jgi:hypothetical protein
MRARIATWRFDDYVRCLAIDDTGHLLRGGYDGEVHRLEMPAVDVLGTLRCA